jgi:hypothetical protein
VFVRLLSASRDPAQTAFARETKLGSYAATVRVPKGGIGGIQIGLLSWSSGRSGRGLSARR